MIGSPVGLDLVPLLAAVHLLVGQAQDGDSDEINFLNGVTPRCHHRWVRSFPWARFVDGVLPPRSKRPQSLRASSVRCLEFLITRVTARRVGGFLRCLRLAKSATCEFQLPYALLLGRERQTNPSLAAQLGAVLRHPAPNCGRADVHALADILDPPQMVDYPPIEVSGIIRPLHIEAKPTSGTEVNRQRRAAAGLDRDSQRPSLRRNVFGIEARGGDLLAHEGAVAFA